MQALVGVACALLILSLIVVVHEAAHAGVARLMGMRVSELFVGLPFGPRVSWRSPRSGIRYGATLALLGGYTRIAGMASEPDEGGRASLALALLNARGCLTAEELARVLGCAPQEAQGLLEALEDLGSAEGVEAGAAGASRAWRTPARDARGLTLADRGHDLSLPGSVQAGEPFTPDCAPDDFLARERSRTYAGAGFWRRAAVLVAGVAANLLCALALVTAYLVFQGVATVSPYLADVAQGSPAAQAGIEAGDAIVAVNGQAVSGYEEFSQAMGQVASSGGEVSLAVARGNEVRDVTVALDEEGLLGVYYGYVQARLGVGEALAYACDYALATGRALAGLFIPSEAAQVVSQSAGMVGVVALTGQAASQGPWALALLMAALSLSLGWLNLVPIPPLDGGKLLMEAVQAVARRRIPLRVQGAVSLVGVGLFMLLFFVMLHQDLTRLLTGGM